MWRNTKSSILAVLSKATEGRRKSSSSRRITPITTASRSFLGNNAFNFYSTFERTRNEQGMIQVRVGDEADLVRTFSEKDVEQFAHLSTDTNDLHVNEEFIFSNATYKKMFPKGRIVHGMFLTSLISAVVGTKLPGPGSIYLNQNFKFLRPAYIGDTVRAYVKVLRGRQDKPIFTLLTEVENVNTREKLVTGEGVIYHPEAQLVVAVVAQQQQPQPQPETTTTTAAAATTTSTSASTSEDNNNNNNNNNNSSSSSSSTKKPTSSSSS